MYYSHFIFSIGLLSFCNSYTVFGRHTLPERLQIWVRENTSWTGNAKEKRVNMKLETQPYFVYTSQRELPVLQLTVTIPGQQTDI